MVYIGGYKNGKRNGRGVEYNENGIFKFEGEYLDGMRNGKGKEYKQDEYSKNNALYFEGNYKNGKKNGKGIIYKSNKIKFEGEYFNDLKKGFGKEYYNTGKVKFEGEYKDNKKWNGLGYHSGDKFKDKDGKKDSSIPIYELKDGKGIIRKYNEYGFLLSEGEYENGKFNGKYKEYEDSFRRDKIIFEGEFKNGKKWIGKGYDENVSGEPIYEINNGKGIIKSYNWSKILEIEYEYLNGEKNGFWKRYSSQNGKLIEECNFKNGRLNGKEKIYNSKTNELISESEYLYDREIKKKIIIKEN